MKRISEAEINSCTKRFLIENDFTFLSTKNNGEKFYYRINEGSPPFYKQPDCLVYKENIVIVWEDKLKYLDLFIDQNGKVCDIEKLKALLFNDKLKQEFLEPISETTGISIDKILLVGGVNSLENEKPNSNPVVPEFLIQLSTIIKKNKSIIKLVNCTDEVKKTIMKVQVLHDL